MIFDNTNKMKFAIFAVAIIYLLSVTVSRKAHHKKHRRSMTSQNFSASCTGTSFIAASSTLKSGCKNLKGATADFDLNLDTCFENRDGVLRKGVGFAKTCTGCIMETKTTILKCTCENAQGKKVAAQVDINSFITNSDGKLTC